jgi:hypothetical protein
MAEPEQRGVCSRRAAFLAIAAASIGAAGCGGASSPSRHAATAASTLRGETPARTLSREERARENPGGTDANIPGFGHAATPRQRAAIDALVRRYYAAAARADGKEACALMYRPLAGSVPEDYGRPPAGLPYARGKTCAVVMTKLFRHLPGPRDAIASTRVTAVRVYRGHAFAELHSHLTPKGEIFVERERERGSWRVGALIGEEQAPRSTG